MIKNGGQPLANALKHFLKTLTSGKNGAMTKEDVIHGLKTLAKQERKAQSLLTRPREAPQEFERWYIAEVLESAVLIIEQRDRLAEEIENLKASGIHTCHDQCKRPMCAMRRQRDMLAEELKEAQNAIEMMLRDSSCRRIPAYTEEQLAAVEGGSDE
jgi:hypothetical protein